MKYFFLVISTIILAVSSTETFAQLPVKPLASQSKLLESKNETPLTRHKTPQH